MSKRKIAFLLSGLAMLTLVRCVSAQTAAEVANSSSLPVPPSVVPKTPVPTPTPSVRATPTPTPVVIATPTPSPIAKEMPVSGSGDWQLWTLLFGGIATCFLASYRLKLESK